jgi:hypothetical protein
VTYAQIDATFYEGFLVYCEHVCALLLGSWQSRSSVIEAIWPSTDGKLQSQDRVCDGVDSQVVSIDVMPDFKRADSRIAILISLFVVYSDLPW